MSQTINLKTRINKPVTIEELEAFALMAIEQINQRTLSNESVYGGSFADYSPKYAEKKGVSVDAVDLFLDGDMLDSLDYEINEDRGTVKIFMNGDLQKKKGYNHHVGDTMPNKRPWFGITPSEVESLIGEIETEPEQTEQVSERITLADLRAAASSILFDVELD